MIDNENKLMCIVKSAVVILILFLIFIFVIVNILMWNNILNVF